MRKLYPDLFDYLSAKARVVFKNHSLPRWVVFSFDGMAVFLTFLFSYLLRFNFIVDDFNIGLALKHSILVVCVYSIFEILFNFAFEYLKRF